MSAEIDGFGSIPESTLVPGNPSYSQSVSPSVSTSKLPRWYVAYLVLAVVNFLALSLSLWLNYRQASLFAESASTYRIYTELLEQVNVTAKFAIAASRPATRVFTSRDVAAESARLNDTVRQFRDSFAELRAAIAAKAPVAAQSEIIANFPDVVGELDAMQVNAQQALNEFAQGKFDQAGQHAAAKDAHFIAMVMNLMESARVIRRTQIEISDRQQAIARDANRFGLILVLISALVTIGVIVHAQRVRRTTKLQRLQRDRIMHALSQARDQAEHGSRAKAQFLANMSHEIRTPMNGVLGMLDALARTPLSEKQMKILRTANRSADLLLSIIDDVLDVSKIEAGQLLIESTPVNLIEIAQHVQSLYNVRAVEKSLQLNCVLPQRPLPKFRSDPTRITQLLSNLVSNAIKFTEAGEVTIAVDVLDEQADSMRIKFSVRDSGMGISAETQQRLFAPFVQADSSTSRRYGGTGLGLAICKQLVLMLDKESGEIGVESTLGNGATFYFVLRLTNAGEVDVQQDISGVHRSVAGAPTHFSGCVLIAEDNETNQHVAVTMLQSLGLQTKLAANGREAIDAVHREHFDLILMDYHMPELDGCGATIGIRRYEQEQNKAHTPIVAVTASALNEDKERCLTAGMDDFLAKPLRQRTLVAVLEKWLPSGAAYVATEPAAAAQSAAAESPSMQTWANLPRDLFDLEQIIEMRAIAGETFGDLIEQFHRSAIDGLASMRNAVECSDAAELKRAAHKLKGAAATLGAKSLADHCYALETMGKEQRLEGALERLHNLEQNYLEVRRHMRTCVERRVAPAA